MEDKQLLALGIVLCVIGGASAAWIMLPPSDTDNYQTQQLEITDSYVMAEGDFECVDVFFQPTTEGIRVDSLWAHITVDGKKYTQYDKYNYEWNRRIYLKFLIHYENNTISDPYEISIATDYVYDFYVDEVLITVYYKS